jgi:hypothetical protein
VSAENTNFANYELPTNGQPFEVHNLANQLLPRIVRAANFTVIAENPKTSSSEQKPFVLSAVADEENLGQLVGLLGPAKELQQNIKLVEQALGEGAPDQIADWVEESGIMAPVERGFMTPRTVAEGEGADRPVLYFGGGVANWQLRRVGVAERFDPAVVSRIVLGFGTREMKPGEHQLVATYANRHEGKLPTEAAFAHEFIVPRLSLAGFKVEVPEIDSNNGDTILDALVEQDPSLLDEHIIVVANAPNAIQAAGQLRIAARKVDSSFDSTGEQLSVVSDSFPLARHGEAPKTHQNPKTALAQLARNALFLARNANN